MRKRSWLSILLLVVVSISLVLTYFHIFNPNLLLRLLNPEHVQTTNTNLNQTNPQFNEYQPTEFYAQTALTFDQVMRPTSFYYFDGGHYYWLNSEEIQQTLNAYLTSRPINVEDLTRPKHTSDFGTLLEGNYLELRFQQEVPIGLLTNYLAIDNPDEATFAVNTIIIPFDNQQAIFIANSRTGDYVEGSLAEQLTRDELQKTLNSKKEQFTPVMRYIAKYGFLYLPQEPLQKSSRLYTLRTLPDSLFVTKIFAKDWDSVFTTKTDTSTIYRNYRYALELNNKTRRLDYTISRIDSGEPTNNVESIHSSFQMIENYDYWTGDIRLTDINNGKITYRRFIDGMPVYSNVNGIDYGASFVYLRENESHDVARFQTPLLIPEAYIDDLSQDYRLPDNEQIIATLDDLGYALADFSEAILAFQWQADMEDYQKVILVPKWYLRFEGRMYDLDQIGTESFRDIYTKASLEGGS